jgi:hypothetical protein
VLPVIKVKKDDQQRIWVGLGGVATVSPLLSSSYGVRSLLSALRRKRINISLYECSVGSV